MRQLIIGVALAVLLVGCGEKPKFSINETDTLETYTNNPIFTKKDPDPSQEMDVYKFVGIPESVDGIKTSDLEILGGYITINNAAYRQGKTFMLTIKGKSSFDKLFDRLTQGGYAKDNNLDCEKLGVEKNYRLMCRNIKDGSRLLVINYSPFTDSATFVINLLHK